MSFFSELQRRNVVRVGIAYVVIGWVVAQVAEFAFESFAAPEWVIKVVIVMLLLGLPFVLAFAWIYEMTPEGLKREKDVDRSTSITPQTGRRIDRVIIGTLVIALAFFAADKYLWRTPPVAEESAEPVAEVVPAPEAEVGPPAKSVAVLPFVAMSDGPDDEYFADGITEEILNSLAQLPELLVTARTSAFAFKGDDLPPIPEIAEQLGVKHVVEGSVRRSGERLRVTAQLIRAEDGFHVWSNNYDSTSADTILVQENIAERIALALDVVLDEQKSAAMRTAGLRDVEAFTAFQKGAKLYEEAHGSVDIVATLEAANFFFDQVIERAPNFAEIYVWHSDLYFHILNDDVLKTGEGLSPEEIEAARATLIADYEAAASRTVNRQARLRNELDLAFIKGNWRGITTRARRAVEGDACAGGNWVPVVANVVGLAAEHRDQMQKIVACDPLRALGWVNLVRAHMWSGDFEEAVRAGREALKVVEGNWLDWMFVRALIETERYEEAQEAIDTQLDGPVWKMAAQALMASKEGNREAFERALADYPGNLEDTFMANMVYAWGGLRDDANRIAARYDQHPWGPWMLWQIAHWCACDNNFDLEAAPNFARMIEDAEIPWPPRSGRKFLLKDW
jgi:TolB-like protein